MPEQAQEPPEIFKKLPPGMSHTETEHGNMTLINDPDKVKQMMEMEEGSIKVQLGGGFEVMLCGFSTIKDAANVEILHIKEKPEKNLILYQLTDHPDSEQALISLRALFIREGLGDVEFQDVEIHCAEYKQMYDGVLSGAIKPEPGCHPKMGYLEEDPRGTQDPNP